MLILGLGGVGTEISRRAHAFGMRVMAIDPKDMERPPFVFSLDKPGNLMERLAQADVVILACPLTNETRGFIGEKQFMTMKKTAYLINIARKELVQKTALREALEKHQIAGAGLNTPDYPWTHNVVFSGNFDHQARNVQELRLSRDSRERQWRLIRENIRRFVAGEPLLAVVDKGKGF